MAKLSPVREQWPLLPGLTPLSRGKIRDTYDLGEHLLIVTTDGLSIFDFVLNALVPEKGSILNIMTYFWLKMLESYGIPTHLVAAGQDIDSYLPEELRGNPDRQSRSMVVKKLNILPFEFVTRKNLTGGGLKDYLKTGEVCGHRLPIGLSDGDELPFFLDTPSTKEATGHDVNVSAANIRRHYPEAVYRSLQIFEIAHDFAAKRGIIIADTKFEFDGRVLGDEVLTPDSSRFWLASEWLKSQQKSPRKAPPSLDKQPVREYGKGLGINDLDPKNDEDNARVHGIEVPDHLIKGVTQAYRYLFWRLTEKRREDYAREVLSIDCPDEPRKVAIVLGSESDLEAVKGLIGHWKDGYLRDRIKELTLQVISCHRNPEQLMNWACAAGQSYDAIIAVGGKAFAMPGVLDAWVYHFHGLKASPVIGVALGDEGSESLAAAQLSIKQIPGEPVIMDETEEEVYTGTEGVWRALERVANDELPPAKPRPDKPPRFNLEL